MGRMSDEQLQAWASEEGAIADMAQEALAAREEVRRAHEALYYQRIETGASDGLRRRLWDRLDRHRLLTGLVHDAVSLSPAPGGALALQMVLLSAMGFGHMSLADARTLLTCAGWRIGGER